MQYKNPGYDPVEIEELKKECEAEQSTFVYFEDEEDMEQSADEYAHFQFVGQHNGAEVIYDGVIYTLRLHHCSMVFEEAEKRATKGYPQYVSQEDRKPGKTYDARLDEEVELLIAEIIDEIEENDEIKVAENIEIDYDFEYGIGLDVCLNVEIIDDEVVENFIEQFKAGKIELDKTLYAFKSDAEEDDE